MTWLSSLYVWTFPSFLNVSRVLIPMSEANPLIRLSKQSKRWFRSFFLVTFIISPGFLTTNCWKVGGSPVYFQFLVKDISISIERKLSTSSMSLTCSQSKKRIVYQCMYHYFPHLKIISFPHLKIISVMFPPPAASMEMLDQSHAHVTKEKACIVRYP